MPLNNKGSIKVALIVFIILLLIVGGITFYVKVIRVTTTGAIELNIIKFRKLVKLYVKMNGYSTTGISAKKLQADGLIPSNYTVKGGWIYPINQDYIQRYWVGPGQIANSFYSFGFKDSSLTNNQAYAICHVFENSINAVALGYNIKWNHIKPNKKCGNIIPKNGSLVPGGEMFLSFE